MDKNKCCIVIPTYKKYEGLNNFEKKTLENTIKIMHEYPIIIIYPEGLEIKGYENIDINKFIPFDKKYFRSVRGYNDLMLSPFLYETFKEYEYMLLVQLDAYIFKNDLEYFIELGYDYIGSLHAINQGTNIHHPGVGDNLVCGNGGFSLRKVNSFIEASKNIMKDLNGMFDWEDVLYSYWYKDKLNIAPPEIALKFGWQQYPEKCYENNNKELPFGSHKPHIFGKNFSVYKNIIGF